MTEAERILSILDNWASGLGARIYLFGSRARGDYNSGSDVDVYIEWPRPPTNEFVSWWTRQNGDRFGGIGNAIGAKVEVLDPDDRDMQKKIRSAKIIAYSGCAIAVSLPRVKPQISVQSVL